MSISSGNGSITLKIGSQVLYWGTCTSVFTADPIDADGVRLEAGSPLTAITVTAGSVVVNNATYYTWGEGPVAITLVTDDGTVIYSGSPRFQVEGHVVEVHPTQAQIEAGLIGDPAAVVTSLADGAVTTGKILNGTIVDADVSGSAAIASTKLANVHIRNRVTFNGASEGATIAPTTRYLANTGAMTVSRAVTLPLANAVAEGTEIVIADENGSCTAVATIVVTCAGSDHILGVTTWTIGRGYGSVRLISDGVSKWTPAGGYPNQIVDNDIATTAAISNTKLSGVHLRSRSIFTKTAYPIVATDRYVAQTGTMDASYAATLPLAAAVPAGTQITIADESGTVTSTFTIAVTRNTADTINGGATAVPIGKPFGWLTLVSDGVSNWTVVGRSAPVTPATITGARSTDDLPIMAALLTALAAQGLIVDGTTAGA